MNHAGLLPKVKEGENRVSVRRTRRGPRSRPDAGVSAGSDVKIQLPGSHRASLKYYIHAGNNGQLVRQHFRHRGEWTPAKCPWELSSMNDGKGLLKIQELAGQTDFIWCQYRSGLGDFSSYDSAPGFSSKQVKSSEHSSGANRGCIINHFSNNSVLTQKARFYQTMVSSGCADLIPDTLIAWVHPELGLQDAEKVADFCEGQDDAVFILKPGAVSRKGVGIKMAKGGMETAAILDSHKPSKARKPWVVQRYIERPLLVHGRKFDIRCFVLLIQQSREPQHCAQNEQARLGEEDEVACYQGYIHPKAYLRTSSYKYSLKNLGNRATHLTNDFVQNKCKAYGKNEQGNKLSMDEFAAILESSHGPGAGDWVRDECWPAIAAASMRTLQAGIKAGLHDRTKYRCQSFELFGFDYMVEHDGSSNELAALKIRLIEVNDNPCLDQMCPLLKDVIDHVIKDTVSVVLDHGFLQKGQQPPPESHQFQRLF